VTGEILIPMLPCRDLDESVGFYECLGFRPTYRQQRPNPYAVVVRDDMEIHLFGLDGFDPASSYGSVALVVPDAERLYNDFAVGLRQRFGRLPAAGIPRILRPRRRHDTIRGFSVVDPGGNWLRVYQQGEAGVRARQDRTTGLTRILENAARLADARGDDRAALALLSRGLDRFPEASPLERARALLYRADLAVRIGELGTAQASLADAEAIDLPADERARLAKDVRHVEEHVRAHD
jgi:catechol 2,3-dioxygenase-like lactoylglutathione lyase family enzyme